MIFSKKWIEKVRAKSAEEQQVIALTISLSLTGFIVVIWLLTIFGTIRTPEIPTANFSLPEIDLNIDNQAGVVESVTNFFQGEETYVID